MFPTLLLVTTLLRLCLNVASTRVVLLHGHAGTGAAGHVIESFGEFVVGGNYAVGFVTKSAGRISEVSARFTLDAMPGKQMAIDAGLNAGIGRRPADRCHRTRSRLSPHPADRSRPERPLVPKAVPLAVVVKVLQNLLAERVPVRDIRSILEVLAESAPH